ncbi:hypothetical protein JZ751_025187 [Albula glossodonta]|uniref:Ig-like domain-containing protein n=1 Tax=Albula glossodonta TaxID=121402 RepID=A0A8T2NIG1_9TELE|nr:hypothetical protein JZ751_025187 [Albula glossodonta]
MSTFFGNALGQRAAVGLLCETHVNLGQGRPAGMSLHVQGQVVRAGEGPLAQHALVGLLASMFAVVSAKLVRAGKLPSTPLPAVFRGRFPSGPAGGTEEPGRRPLAVMQSPGAPALPVRDLPHPPRPSEAGEARQVNKVWRYLEETGLQRNAERLFVNVLQQPCIEETLAKYTIPANPYPAITQGLRQFARRLASKKSSSDKPFRRALSLPTTLTAITHVAGAKGYSHVWGLPSILRCVNPQEMERYHWMLEDVTPPLSKMGNHRPCIFSGTLLPASPPPSLDLLQTYIIVGPDPRRACSLFARCLCDDVIRMSQQGRHRVLRVTVPGNRGEIHAFSKEEASLQGSKLEEAVQSWMDCGSEGIMKVECVWRVDPHGMCYQGGSKTYCLTVIQTAQDHKEKERVLSFPQCPLLFLCSSVFHQQAQAEAYSRAHIPPNTESGVGVFEPVRDAIAEKLSALCLPHDALPAAHLCFTLLLLLQDDSAVTHTPPMEALQQLFRFVRSPAAKLWALRQHALTLCQLLQSQPEESMDAEIRSALAGQLLRLLEDHVAEAGSSSSWCSDSRLSLESLRMRLQAVCSHLAHGSSHTALDELRQWYWSSSVLECQFLSDSLAWVPILKDVTQRAEQRNAITEAAQRAVWEQDLQYHRQRTVELKHTGDPSQLSTQLSQYLVDCAVDQVWERCLWKVLSVSPLPSNPYPSLVQEFRLAALRMSLWGQSDAEVLKQLWPLQPPQPCSPEGPLHCGPEGQGYGLLSALRASHPDRLRECMSLARSMESHPRHAGRFKVEHSTAVLSPRAWLGMLSPFLCGLQVVEFCYITAPPGCLDEVLQECFSDALRQKHPVHLQVFQAPCGRAEWRFLALQKHFVLYCLHNDGSPWLCLPQHSPLSLHQAVFTSLDRATFHFRTVGWDSFFGGSEQKVMSQLHSEITASFLRGEILHVYRLVALRSLLRGEHGVLPDCWRVCHSICAQSEFLCAVAECLQDLFALCEEGERSESSETAVKFQAAIEGMFEGFSWLLRQTLQHPDFLAPPGLWETVLKGQEAVAGGSRAVWVRGGLGVCQAVSRALSHDLHSLCPEVKALVDRLGTAGERGEVRARICCTESVPPNMQPLSRREPVYSDQTPICVPDTPAFTPPAPSLTLESFGEAAAVLLCQTSGGHAGVHFQLYRLTDQVDTLDFEQERQEARFSVTNEAGASEELYCCMYHDSQGRYSGFSRYLKLSWTAPVTPPPQPVLSVEPSSGRVFRGQSLSFHCSAPPSQSPAPQAFLLLRQGPDREGSLVAPMSVISQYIDRPGSEVSFSLGPVQGGEGGSYTCLYQVTLPTNGHKNSATSKPVHVTVLELLPAPTLSLVVPDPEDEGVVLRCTGSQSYPGLHSACDLTLCPCCPPFCSPDWPLIAGSVSAVFLFLLVLAVLGVGVHRRGMGFQSHGTAQNIFLVNPSGSSIYI